MTKQKITKIKKSNKPNYQPTTIPKDAYAVVRELREMYAKELGVNTVTITDAIGLAVKNEHARYQKMAVAQ